MSLSAFCSGGRGLCTEYVLDRSVEVAAAASGEQTEVGLVRAPAPMGDDVWWDVIRSGRGTGVLDSVLFGCLSGRSCMRCVLGAVTASQPGGRAEGFWLVGRERKLWLEVWGSVSLRWCQVPAVDGGGAMGMGAGGQVRSVLGGRCH